MAANFGILYIVATPIGNLEDFSPRAIRVLREVDYVAAEDTRHSQPLLMHFGIGTSLFPLHDYNEQQQVDKVITYLKQGKSVALISDAGTPLISDPGYRVVKQVREQGFKVVPVPGACALVAALSAAGLPSDKFIFDGFLPVKSSARQKRLQALVKEERTLIFYEAPHRILDSLDDFIAVFGAERHAVLARELTKTFETILSGSLSELKKILLTDHNQQKGEFVILVQGAETVDYDETKSQQVLEILLGELPVKQAANLAAKITGDSKNKLYELALRLKNK